MGIYIKGVAMPKAGAAIVVFPDGDVWSGGKRIAKVGTAMEVPPHGRLIDAGAFAAKFIAALPGGIDDLVDKSRAPEFVSQIQALLMDIAEAPTIIPESRQTRKKRRTR